MKLLHDMLTFFAQQNQSSSLLKTDEADEAFNVTENKTWESLNWEVKEFGNESFMRVWSNGRNESKKRGWEKKNDQIPSSLAILYSRKLLEVAIQRSSRVQK